ncbi:coiled-coil domain-containing protein 178-like [Ptychodera flava]|uniref:coiled-coil domain-containing protein 178-like n=1 Tax=Ptychodera flava TaxID=63121 RepID=UPI003969D765
MPTVNGSLPIGDLPTRDQFASVNMDLQSEAAAQSKAESSMSDVERFSKGSPMTQYSMGTSNLSRLDTKAAARDVSDEDKIDEESKDQLFPLLSGWPRLQDKIFRRRALYFKKPMSVSIDTAVEHIQKLQDRLEEWSRDVEMEVLSRKSTSSRATSAAISVKDMVPSRVPSALTEPKAVASGRRHIRFAPSSAGTVSSAPSTADYDQGLSIFGQGAIIPETETESVVEEEELPQLGAEEVIDEVVVLLGRLETDRCDSEAMYQEERRRSAMLSARIDKLAEKRLHELPLAVQKEHEACALDISELQWHCSYRGRQEDRVRSKVEIAEVLNSRLLEDISFVKTHSPLVEEKLELELEAMHKIQQAQMQTLDELDKTYEKLRQTESKSAEAHAKAEMERGHIKKELDTVRQALHEISTELDEARKTFANYTHQCDIYRRKLQQNEEEQLVQETKNENAKVAEKIQGKKMKQVKDKIVEAEFEHRKLSDINNKMSSEKAEREHFLRTENLDMEREAQANLTKLRETQQFNKEMKMEIEDIDEKLADCGRQKIADVKNMERIKREMGKVEQQLKITLDEHKRVDTINRAIREKVMKEEENIQGSEDQLRATSDALKKQLKDEQHSRTVLQARITSDTAELQKLQQDAKRKRMKVTKKADETDKVVSHVLKQVEHLRKIHADKQKRIHNLEENLNNLQKRYKDTEEFLLNKKNVLEPRHKELSTEILNKKKRLDYMEHRTEVIGKKIDEMQSSAAIMNKVLVKTEEEIKDLSEELEEVTIQLEFGQKMQEELKQSLHDVQKRTTDMSLEHEKHLNERAIVLNDLEAKLEKKLVDNKELAHQYRLLQEKLILAKNKVLSEFDDRIRYEASLKDHKQLNGLQTRLHAALLVYYKIRGLFNEAELAKFEAISQKNGSRIQYLQSDMDQAISTIAKFLNDQIDGTAAAMVTQAARAALFEGSEPKVAAKPVELKSALKRTVTIS